MRQGLKIGIGVLLLGGILVGVFAIKNNREKIPKPRIYYYYPLANMYYDSTEATYIFFDTSKIWKETTELPVKQGDIGKNVRINKPSEPVWKDNDQHRLFYSVSLYSDSNDWKIKVPEEVPTAKGDESEKNTDSADAAANAKKKSGVKKFLDRIFKPKKKKDN